jgi:hypothetical protein
VIITMNNLNAMRGQIKTLGAFGDKYQVLKPICQLENGDWLMRVKILATQENINYRYSEILCDPTA